jgi:hypothetical protein
VRAIYDELGIRPSDQALINDYLWISEKNLRRCSGPGTSAKFLAPVGPVTLGK